jgi:hypothetical protein
MVYKYVCFVCMACLRVCLLLPKHQYKFLVYHVIIVTWLNKMCILIFLYSSNVSDQGQIQECWEGGGAGGWQGGELLDILTFFGLCKLTNVLTKHIFLQKDTFTQHCKHFFFFFLLFNNFI